MSLRNDSKPAVDRARRLRREMTALEKALWLRLRNEGLGVKFRRQYPAGPYTLDFYGPAVKLCVEIDGPLHNETRDARRDAFLAREGILTLRFTSQEVYVDIEPVLTRIWQECEARKTPPKSSQANIGSTPSPTVFHAGARSHPFVPQGEQSLEP